MKSYLNIPISDEFVPGTPEYRARKSSYMSTLSGLGDIALNRMREEREKRTCPHC